MLSKEERFILVELCELSIRVQKERLEKITEEFSESTDIIKSTQRLYNELQRKEKIIDKLREIEIKENTI